jgi:DNA uptake protein ComE-like DNA-binding protein
MKMKNQILKMVLTALSVLLCASISLAADVKAPEAKNAAKATADSAKIDVKASAKKELVDINSATEAELKAIPGIGDAYAAKIVVGRPYANKTQLKSRNILPGPAYEKVKDQIIAKQPAKEAGKDASSKPADKDAPAKKK